MIQEYLLLVISLVLAVLLLVMLGEKIKISYPIFLVIGGLFISFLPGIPVIQIDPQLVFLIFLPPILYEGAWYTSWPDFWKWRRSISLLAIVLVFFTSLVLAVVSQSMIPGFTLAMGFLLGGIIAPTDSIASISVLKGIKVPKRLVTIIEGESLVNDASGLIVFRFALFTILTGQFFMQSLVVDFFVVSGFGILIGLFLAGIIYLIHRFLPTTPSIDTAMTLLTPYIMYIVAEYFQCSGVLSVISGGLFLSSQSHNILTHHSRQQAKHVWSTLVFLINGTVFILIGLELPFIVASLNGISLGEGITYGVLISLIVIGIRFLGTYLATFIPRILSKKIRETEKNPGWKGAFLVGYTGMRGVVSLAAALSIPMTLSSGGAFPQRSLILFITFIVILVTLVLQGLALPLVLKWLHIGEIEETIPEQEQEISLEIHLKKIVHETLKKNYMHAVSSNELIANQLLHLENDIRFNNQQLESLECGACGIAESAEYKQVMRELIAVQRRELLALGRKQHYEVEVLRKQADRLDIDEIKLG